MVIIMGASTMTLYAQQKIKGNQGGGKVTINLCGHINHNLVILSMMS